MTRVDNVDRIVAALRRRLLDKSAAGRPAAPAAAGGQGKAVQGPAGIEALDDPLLRRTLIQDILADQFGHGLINDAGFQQVVDRVVSALDRDPAAAELLARVVADLRAQA